MNMKQLIFDFKIKIRKFVQNNVKIQPTPTFISKCEKWKMGLLNLEKCGKTQVHKMKIV